MEKIYIIKKHSNNIDINSNAWDSADIAFINCFKWDETGYRPHTEVRALYSDQGITVKFTTNEAPAVSKYTRLNDPTFKDSCVEIFFNPAPETSDKYMNFEINPAGAFLLGLGKDRNRENLYDIDTGIFGVQTLIVNNGWSAKIYIPFVFLKKYYLDISMVMKGNFQKCGDETPNPHYGSWAPIETKAPDFHRPEYFGTFILQE